MPYQWANLNLSPSSAQPLVMECLRKHHPVPVQKKDLTKFAVVQHCELGGLSGGDAVGTVKKTLAGLLDEKKIFRPQFGSYALCSEADGDVDSVAEGTVDDSAGIVAQETLGDGPELVYVYYYENDARVAQELDKKDVWACKIGFTTRRLTTRILGQIGAAIPCIPVVALELRTSDGSRLERAIHFALDEADARKEDAVGREWFITSPGRVKDWFLDHIEIVERLRVPGSDPSVADQEHPLAA